MRSLHTPLRLAAALLIAVAAPAMASETTDSQSSAESAGQNGAARQAPRSVSARPKERKICKTIEVTGSNIPMKQKICRTARQWQKAGG